MVYSGNGISYTELANMDLAEFREAVAAKVIYNQMVKDAQQQQ